MATYTYTWSPLKGGDKVVIKAAKDDVARLKSAVDRAIGLPAYRRELTGIIGETDENQSGYMFSLYSSETFPVRNPEEWQAKIAALVTKLTAKTLTKQDIPGLMAEAGAIFNQHICIVDKRETREAHDARIQASNAAHAQRMAEIQAQDDAFYAKWSQPGQEVAWGDGEMAVYLKFTYNNSDAMTDYFDFHAPWGKPLLLAVVRSGPRTEAVARRVLDQYPELAGTYTWHEENYSMGHGNYLMGQDALDVAQGKSRYGGGENPPVVAEIRFQTHAGKMVPYRSYKPAVAAPPEEAAPQSGILLIEQAMHTQKNVPIWLVKITQRVDRDAYDRLSALARRFSGNWSRYSSAFLFYEEAKATAFVFQARIQVKM